MNFGEEFTKPAEGLACGTVVAWGVPPAIVGGNPGTVLRHRFGVADIERLQRLRWWDWDAAKVTRNVKTLCAADLDALERYS